MTQLKKPSVVFILVDNLGWGDLGCYGGLAPTPRLDQLASEGMRFKNYNVEAQCMPMYRVDDLIPVTYRAKIPRGNASYPRLV